jgi:hypothetical protein
VEKTAVSGVPDCRNYCEMLCVMYKYFFEGGCDATRVMASSFLSFLDHTQRRIPIGRTSLEELSARRRDLYLTTHNTQHRQTSMPAAGLEPTIPASKRPYTHALTFKSLAVSLRTTRLNIQNFYMVLALR